MTTRRPSPGSPHADQRRLTRDDFPALTAFFSGYLHEDLIPEHGSAAQAARAFRADASRSERRAVEVELRRLIARIHGWTMEEVRRGLMALGAAWVPASVTEIEALLQAPPD